MYDNRVLTIPASFKKVCGPIKNLWHTYNIYTSSDGRFIIEMLSDISGMPLRAVELPADQVARGLLLGEQPLSIYEQVFGSPATGRFYYYFVQPER